MDQLKELENTSRIVKNIYSLIMDSEYKGNLSHIVSEAVSFLDAFQKNVDGALENVRFELKRQAESKQDQPKAVDNEAASLPSKG